MESDLEFDDECAMDVINIIRRELANGGQNIASFKCKGIQIGNYTSKDERTYVHFSENGILFQARNIATGILMDSAIRRSNIIRIHQCVRNYPYFVVKVGEGDASLIKEILEFNTKRANRKKYCFDPNNSSCGYIIYELCDPVEIHQSTFLEELYGRKLVNVPVDEGQAFYSKITDANKIVTIKDSDHSSESGDEPEYLYETVIRAASKRSEAEDNDVRVVEATPSTPSTLEGTEAKSPSPNCSSPQPRIRILPINVEYSDDQVSSTNQELNNGRSYSDKSRRSYTFPEIGKSGQMTRSVTRIIQINIESDSPSLVKPTRLSEDSPDHSITEILESPPESTAIFEGSLDDDDLSESPPVQEICQPGPSTIKQSQRNFDVIELDDLENSEAVNSEILFMYPKDDKDSNKIAITISDIECLEVGAWLNDSIIDFWCQYYYLEKLSHENQKKSYIFSAFFYPSLLSACKRAPNGVTSKDVKLWRTFNDSISIWLKSVDIFAKDFLFVPLSENNHWVLAVICFPGRVKNVKRRSRETNSKRPRLVENYGHSDDSDDDCEGETCPCILILDSMTDEHSRQHIFRVLRTFLQQASQLRGRKMTSFTPESMPGRFLVVPQQQNYSDCGIYILKFLELFFLKPIKGIEFKDLPDKSDWISKGEASQMRFQIFWEISKYVKLHHPDKVHLFPQIISKESSSNGSVSQNV